KPVRFIVAFSPGGIADTIARSVGLKMSERIGQPVIVENRSGAGGALAAKVVAQAQPDGYTVLVTTTAIAVNAAASKDAVDPVSQLAPVAIGASTPTIFAVHGSVKAKNLMEFVRGAKGGRFTYSSAGIGTTQHLTGEYVFRAVPGLDPTHVPFQGGSPVNTAVVAGQVDVASTTLPTASAYIRQGTMRAIAVAAHARMPLLPDVPTLAESGFPDFEDRSWIAFFAPAGTPAPAVAVLNDEINAALRRPDVRERLATIGLDAQTMTPREFADYVKSEIAKWARIIQATGIRPD
ncbi:MAG TPA: tripartite tricarboxylate transporter substrate-binding protein, partial [Candidatus Binatia bacterium]|nr:tripartite tricarboxylate transporter substrate-binding protein [Candidatus Binatia bacterium]